MFQPGRGMLYLYYLHSILELFNHGYQIRPHSSVGARVGCLVFEKQGLGSDGALIHDSILGTASLCFEKFLLLAELEQVKPIPELSQGQGPACNPEVLLFILEALFHS